MKVDSTYLIEGSTGLPQSKTHVRIGAFEPISHVAGPGSRAVLWVTGCQRRCPGCIKPEYLDFKAGELIEVTKLAEKILAVDSISGVTFSGGEPFEQSLALSELSKLVKNAGLDVLAYSGYELSALAAKPKRFGALLQQLDWLIDGQYEDKLHGPLQYRGSENQLLLVRTDNGNFIPVETTEHHDVQISVNNGGIRLTGFPNRDFQRSFTDALSSRGIVLKAQETDRQ